MAKNSTQALAATEIHSDLNLVILDLTLPGLDGWGMLRELGHRYPQLPVLVLSASENPHDVQRALHSGALGYVPKSAAADVLLNALNQVLSGNIYIPPIILDRNTKLLDQDILTPRQLEVLQQLGEDNTNKAIAGVLLIEEKTVKAHITAIFNALGVKRRTQAVIVARQMKLIE